MKEKFLLTKLLIIVFVVLNAVTYTSVSKKMFDESICYYEDTKYTLVEKSEVSKSFTSYLYKDEENNFMSKIYDYNTNEEMSIEDLIKKEYLNDYNNKIKELLILKYPRFVYEALIKEDVKMSYLFKDNELVIYFSNYKINPSLNDTLFLRVNYNEIKDYINFTVILDSKYENEDGYNYSNLKKSVAFTFDDSPNKGKTEKILSLLNDNHFSATFFVVGEKVLNNKDILYSIKSSKSEVGSHSYKHDNMSKVSDQEFIKDFNMVSDIYKHIFNEPLKYYRPPYGVIKTTQMGLVPVSYILWSLDTKDWKHRNKDYIVNYVINNIKDGDIVLFHDSYDSTVLAITELLPILYSKGYQVMSVSELANIKNVTLEEFQLYRKIV